MTQQILYTRLFKELDREKDEKVMTTALSTTKIDLTKLCSGLFPRLRIF